MQFKILRSTGPVKKMLVEYACPTCSSLLKNPLSEAGQADNCPECNASFNVPGKKDFDKFSQGEVESLMKAASEKSRVNEAKARQEETRRKQQVTTNPSIEQASSLNAWLSNAVSIVNGAMFVIICLAGIGLAFIQFVAAAKADNYVVGGFLASAIIISAFLCGILVCGVTALLCSIQTDLRTLVKRGK
ncbi:MAG TPA: hypothetical protein EYN32_05390 [Phycisphaerales bacterium]|nr:hypothetical protein [Phycisphaerales bacterium]